MILDPGHGGHDPGARSGYTFEKHLAFDVARRVEVILQEQGVRTKFTRTRDVFIPLSSRVRISNSYRDAIFVSIHSIPRQLLGRTDLFFANNGIPCLFKSRTTGPKHQYNAADNNESFYVLALVLHEWQAAVGM